MDAQNSGKSVVKTTIGYNDPSSTTATGQVRTWKSGATTYTYAYDARGNITSVSDGQNTTTYAYDSFDQLVRENNQAAGKTWTYAYDSDGKRITKTVNGTTYNYHYLGDQLVELTWGGNKLHFTYDSTGPLSVNCNGTEYFYVKNAQGDVTGLVTTSGTRVVTYTYDVWGNLLSTTGSMAATLGAQNPLRYRGYVYDTETGLYYLQSRYYNPTWGRFINADDTTLLLSSPGKAHWDKNVFAYCDNNPLNRVDEDGECWDIIIGGIVGGIVSGASSIVNDAIMGRETTVGSVLESVIVGVIAGGVSAAISVKYDMDILTSMSAGLATLIGSLVTGTGVMESLLAAATAAVSTLLSSRLGSGFSDNIGSGIVSLVTSGNTEGLASVGRGVYKAASRRSQSTQTKKSTAKAKTPIQSPTAPKIPTSADKSLQDWRRTILPPFLQFGGICYAHR